MNLGIAVKVAIVTGGASGLGKAIAIRLAMERVIVVVADIDELAMNATADELRATDARVLTRSGAHGAGALRQSVNMASASGLGAAPYNPGAPRVGVLPMQLANPAWCSS